MAYSTVIEPKEDAVLKGFCATVSFTSIEAIEFGTIITKKSRATKEIDSSAFYLRAVMKNASKTLSRMISLLLMAGSKNRRSNLRTHTKPNFFRRKL